MNCRNVVFLSLIFVMVPIWIGYMWVRILGLKGWAVCLLSSWALGFATMLAVGQIILVPLVALQQTLSVAITIWKAALQILAAGSFVCLLFDKAYRKQVQAEHKCHNCWTYVLGAFAVILILIQAYIPAHYEHSDDDDSRFVAEQVSAVEHDTMYQESPIIAEYMYWNEGEVRKDLTSPWAMFMAIVSKLSGIAPAVLSHTYAPFFLILLCYAVYALLGQALLGDDWEKTFLFLIFLSVLHLSGYTSTHSLASMLLLRIWQGKALCAGFMIPLMLYLFYQIMQKNYNNRWLILLYVVSTGACLLSGIGIVIMPIMLFLYGVLDFIYHRAWRKTLSIWMAAVPCGIFLVYYLM